MLQFSGDERYRTIGEIAPLHDLLEYGQHDTKPPILAPRPDSESNLLPDFGRRGLDSVAKKRVLTLDDVLEM